MLNRVKELLEREGKSGYWLSKQTHISPQSIYHILNNGPDIDDLKYGTVRRIAAALNVEVGELAGK